jgi:hypothetical protein
MRLGPRRKESFDFRLAAREENAGECLRTITTCVPSISASMLQPGVLL